MEPAPLGRMVRADGRDGATAPRKWAWVVNGDRRARGTALAGLAARRTSLMDVGGIARLHANPAGAPKQRAPSWGSLIFPEDI